MTLWPCFSCTIFVTRPKTFRWRHTSDNGISVCVERTFFNILKFLVNQNSTIFHLATDPNSHLCITVQRHFCCWCSMTSRFKFCDEHYRLKWHFVHHFNVSLEKTCSLLTWELSLLKNRSLQKLKLKPSSVGIAIRTKMQSRIKFLLNPEDMFQMKSCK